jgi:hypothetical protein
VEKADVNLNLPGMIRFLLAHFRDVPLLKEYLEICTPLLCCAVLCCAVLCGAVRCCAVLCCSLC